MSKSKKRFLPESIESALRSLASLSLGIGLFALALTLTLALIFHNPWLSGVGAVSGFGHQSVVGNIIAAFIYVIGFVPTLFVFLYILRVSIGLLLRSPDASPEYDAMRAFIAVFFASAGLGLILPSASMGGMAGVIISADVSSLVGGFSLLLGIMSMIVFFVMAGMLLHIKLKYIAVMYRSVRHVVMTLASALHLVQYNPPSEEDIEEYEEEAEEEYEEYEEEEEEYEEEAKPRKKSVRKTVSLFRLPDPKFLEKTIFAKYSVTPDLKRNAANMEASFEQYGVIGEVRGIKPGPVVTLYEFEPVLGMRYKSIEQTVPDMTRSMETINIRMAPIPGTKFVGVEMVNMSREEIRMQNLITDKSFKESKAAIPVILGVNIGGNPIVIDLAKQPHMLIAGRTGSGKSVFMQSILMSLFYRFSPDELKIIMVDPKTVEFALWENIPHLMAPVVSDAQKSVNVMKWAVREMEERYKKFKDNAVQNITGYNQVMEEMRK
ncbi:MAG: FtsK/SpoIIIE domain-containing protein, partial [Alphaproteobacteria bacterium]|nr:FtsK/SpoIIIE domain-containing protein [Alphaproteobacteria bacterium]